MKITLLSDDAIRLEPVAGPLTIQAAAADMQYSPFQMVASGLASCTFSVLYSWASHAKLSVDDLAVEVRWGFADDPHRMSDIRVVLDWPSLPASRVASAKRASELCTIHATLGHPNAVAVSVANKESASAKQPAGAHA